MREKIYDMIDTLRVTHGQALQILSYGSTTPKFSCESSTEDTHAGCWLLFSIG